MDLFPLKGRFEPGEPVRLWLEGQWKPGSKARLEIRRLGELWFSLEMVLTGNGQEILLPVCDENFAGLAITLYLPEGKALHTAVDIAPWGKVIRYGFLSGFAKGDIDEKDITAMCQYHINAVQFYDWSYRHDALVAPMEDFHDMMGKRNSLSCIQGKIMACHRAGMQALGYGAVYAASLAFRQSHPDWSLFNSAGEPYSFIDIFFLMNMAKGSPWRDHLLHQYQQAMSQMGFDGIHMDTYGFPKAARNAKGEMIYLDEEFPSLIEQAKGLTGPNGQSPTLIFNNVGGWPVEATRNADQDAVYIEVWPPNDRYRHLKQLILEAKQGGKPVILAAYMGPFRLDTKERALEATLLATFAIAAQGATHLFMGEEHQALTQGYYADHSPLAPFQIMALRTYNDFFVAFEELFYDNTLTDVTRTHAGWDNMEYCCNVPWSADGEGGSLWLTLRQNHKRKTIAFVNLKSNNDDHWNEGKEAPMPLEKVQVSILLERPLAKISYASPDDEYASWGQALTGEIEHTQQGQAAVVELPTLQRCGLLWIDLL